MERRELLRQLATSAALGGLKWATPGRLLELGCAVHAQAVGADTGLRLLDPDTRRLVAVMAERIIPEDDLPGAAAARVDRFIDYMLADWYEPIDRDRVLAGLRALDERARRTNGSSFVGSTEATQLALLNELDDEVQSRAPGPGVDPDAHWFATFKYLTVWGYCTSEVAARDALGTFPPARRYDPCAPYTPRTVGGAPRRGA